MTIPLQLHAGMVLAIQGTAPTSRLIELGEDLINLPPYSHIAMLHHLDSSGTWWAIEGRPGGVGWRAATPYLRSPHLVINHDQPIPPAAAVAICQGMVSLLGTPYDYRAIEEDAARDLHLPLLWAEDWRGQGPPAHVVCSSLAAYLYAHYGLPHPSTADLSHTEPGDWVKFILMKGWATPTPS